jgi:hypothetical protein
MRRADEFDEPASGFDEPGSDVLLGIDAVEHEHTRVESELERRLVADGEAAAAEPVDDPGEDYPEPDDPRRT